jgi:hypothetical protein
MLIATDENAIKIISKRRPIDLDGWKYIIERGRLSINAMEVVASVETSRQIGRGEIPALKLIRVCLCSEIPDPCGRVDCTSSGNPDGRIDIDAP